MTSRKLGGGIVALHGFPGAGKDAIADVLVQQCGYTKLAFADALYADVAHIFGTTEDHLRSRDVKQNPQDLLCIFNCKNPAYRKFLKDRGEDVYTPRTSRYHLDRYGTDYMRTVDPMHWVRIVMARLDSRDDENVVISDLRAYADGREYVGLRRFAGYSGRSLCVVNVLREGARAPDNHEAHSSLPPTAIDFTVVNVEGRVFDAAHKIERHVGRIVTA